MARELEAKESDYLNKMLGQLRSKSGRNKLRTAYIDQKYRLQRMGPAVPQYIRDLDFALGWPAKACDVPSLMIMPDGFTLANGSSVLDDVEAITESARFRAQQQMAIDESLRSAVAFRFITAGDTSEGEPEVVSTVRDPSKATAIKNARTGRLEAALELVDRGNVLMYLPGRVLDIVRDNQGWQVSEDIPQPHDMLACVPYIWGETLQRPFGRSRVTRSLMHLTDMGVRTMLRMEGHGDAYASPRDVLLGAMEEHFKDPATGKRVDPLTALQNGFWGIPDVYDEDADEMIRVDFKRLTSSSQQPHSEHLRTIAMQVASETSIPLNYLGVISEQPPSAQAIEAAKSDMAAVVRGQLPGYEDARVQEAKLIAAILKKGDSQEAALSDLDGLRAGFVDPERSTKSAQADAGVKFNSTFPDADPEVAMEIYGLSKSQRERMLQFQQKARSRSLVESLVAGRTMTPDTTVAAGDAAATGNDTKAMKDKADAMGALIRAGVKPENAAKQVGLSGLEFHPNAMPITLRQEP